MCATFIGAHRKAKALRNQYQQNWARKLIGHITASPFHTERKINISLFPIPSLVNPLNSVKFAVTNSIMKVIEVPES